VKTVLSISIFLALQGVVRAQETDAASFRSDMLEHSAFRKVVEREFKDWDEDDDGRLDHEDGAIGPDGLFLSEAIFNRADADHDGSVSVTEYIDFQIAESFYALDTNRNQTLSAGEKQRIGNPKKFFSWLDRGNLSFEVEGDVAYCNGTTKRKVVKQFKALFAEHPEVKTLVFGWMPGSNDDERLLKSLAIIRERGVNTHAADHARIYSGGVDLFTAGTRRTMGEDVEFGVHTWTSGRRREGRKLPKNHRQHKPYLDYYNSVDVPVDFYWFTLEAAGGDAMHLMTTEELKKYRIVSE
jgi:hypothetical protein